MGMTSHLPTTKLWPHSIQRMTVLTLVYSHFLRTNLIIKYLQL